MLQKFSTAQLCPYKNPSGACNLTFDDDVSKIMEESRNPKELKYYWKEFREKTGEKYKNLFLQAVKLENKRANLTGYKNKASFLISEYEDLDFVKSIAEEVKKLTPLYKEIHAYVRRKLMKLYKNETIMKDGPIPAHLLGNMYAQHWSHIYKHVVPYPDVKDRLNITAAMLNKVTIFL
ncbi:angiotensin-converting enzyme [Trichonephila clavata]|uniref:Angiotensin-converting enzyme n=1 Tax=Trichonephila clavata TaxID=2740835 RepID=A0A8X6F992_TRICU|nr:angiotensin-converting enzyme [Trichonephila clavata]